MEVLRQGLGCPPTGQQMRKREPGGQRQDGLDQDTDDQDKDLARLPVPTVADHGASCREVGRDDITSDGEGRRRGGRVKQRLAASHCCRQVGFGLGRGC
jgi:hypothetical protein